MKRKIPQDDVIVDPEILEKVTRALQSDHVKPLGNCVICGSECAPNSTEKLCWVCRRLKISAWKDSEQQQSIQE